VSQIQDVFVDFPQSVRGAEPLTHGEDAESASGTAAACSCGRTAESKARGDETHRTDRECERGLTESSADGASCGRCEKKEAKEKEMIAGSLLSMYLS